MFTAVMVWMSPSAVAQQAGSAQGSAKFRASHPKFTTALSQVIQRHKGLSPQDRLARSGFEAFKKNRHHMITHDDQIQVYVWLHDWTPETLAAIRIAGVAWSVDDPDQRVLQATLPMDDLAGLADLQVVKAITLPIYAHYNVGNLTTSGDTTLRTAEVRSAYAVSGAGVKVGVISDGFGDGGFFTFPNRIFESCTDTILINHTTEAYRFADPNTCDLPPVIAPPFVSDEPALDDCASLLFSVDDQPTTVTDTSVGLIPGHFGKVRYRSFINSPAAEQLINLTLEIEGFAPGSELYQPYLVTLGSEGTALMEIIHDIAPDAQLFFANFNTSLEFAQAKKWLVAQGVDIICDDIGFFGEGLLDGTSPSSSLNADITRQGISYVTAVGNMQDLHVRSRYAENPFNPTGFHNFRLPPTAAQQGDTTFDMILPLGGSYIFALTWQNEFNNPVDDLDIFLLNTQQLDVAQPLAFSADFQGPGSPGLNNPVEIIFFDNFSGFTEISLVITRKDQQPVNRPGPLFDVFMLGDFPSNAFREPQYMTPYGSVTNNNDAGGDVISVGAIDGVQALGDQFVLEPFSSFGPTWDNRNKPELCAVDNVNVNTTGFQTFFGTSAAAPHVAGALALMKEYYPEMKPSQGRSYIMAFAKDLFPGQAFPEFGIDDATGPDPISGAGLLDMDNVFTNLDMLIVSDFAPATRLYAFDADAEGWATQSLSGIGFNEPIFGSDGGALTMDGGGSLSYGSWISPKIDFAGRTALLGETVYIMRANISSTAGNDNFPTFRLRLSNYRNENVAERIINSVDGNAIAPGAGRDYYVYFTPDSVSLADGLFAAVDLLNFNDFDDVSAVLSINEVEIMEVHTNIPQP